MSCEGTVNNDNASLTVDFSEVLGCNHTRTYFEVWNTGDNDAILNLCGIGSVQDNTGVYIKAGESWKVDNYPHEICGKAVVGTTTLQFIEY